MTTCFWIEPDGTVHSRVGEHIHASILEKIDNDMHFHDDAFAEDYLRGIIHGSELSLQWGGRLTASQRRVVCDDYAPKCMTFVFSEASVHYDPEVYTEASVMRNDSNFTRMFNKALRGVFGKWDKE